VTAFLIASFIPLWDSSMAAWSWALLTHSLKSLGEFVYSSPAIANTKTAASSEGYP
jgi:hypothetical protein